MRPTAIILKKIPKGEYDDLIICYTKHEGKQTYQAKGVKRHTSLQANHLDILNLIDFSLVRGNGHPIITSANCLDSFGGIKSSLKSLAASFVVVDYFDKFIFAAQRDDKLWDFLNETLQEYNRLSGDNNTDWNPVIQKTKHDFIRTLGYHGDTLASHLSGAPLESLRFVQKVIQ
ncbi:MAG: hypothetical protein CEN90_647 [Parcubacteria group bacterium Licking1014_17]|nr:MAG: hypothetical protein CEN90_647 [Parcubacteria group bacterium Licking1014_17]